MFAPDCRDFTSTRQIRDPMMQKLNRQAVPSETDREMPGLRHMGPMAQDFYAAFGLGGSDTTITSVDPDGDRVVNLFDPRRERWEDHFRVVNAQIQGKSPTGRATAWLLQMNAQRRVELRAQLLLLDLW